MTMIEVIGLVVSSGIALRVVEHFLTRKAQKNTEEQQTITNIDNSAETWQKMIDKLEIRVSKLIEQTNCLQEENVSLKDQIYKLKNEIVILKHSQRKIDRYEKQIKQLEEKVCTYEHLLSDNNIAF